MTVTYLATFVLLSISFVTNYFVARLKISVQRDTDLEKDESGIWTG
jgi:hypothetical protein